MQKLNLMKLKTRSAASYGIQPGNGSSLFYSSRGPLGAKDKVMKYISTDMDWTLDRGNYKKI